VVHVLWESNAQLAGVEDTTMKRHRHTPEQIVRKLREGDRLLNEGKDLTEVLRALEAGCPVAGALGRAASARPSGIPPGLGSLCAVGAGAVLWAVVAGSGNAWVLIVEIVRDAHYRPLDPEEQS
jgi:hypothetical protein